MADLTDLQAAQTVKVIGSDASGVEANPVNADSNGNLLVKDYASGSVSGGTVAAVSSLMGGHYNAVLPSLTDGQQAALQVDSSGRLIIAPILPTGAATEATLSALNTKVISTKASTSSVTSVASSASNVTLLAANANRLMATFYNDSTKDCYLKFGATASTSSFTIKMSNQSYLELPYPVYTGIIDAVWQSANGNMRITELTV